MIPSLRLDTHHLMEYLAHFIERVRNSTDKRFILTTREYILSEL